MGRLTGKVAIVTGGARGIGASIVRVFVAEGARVVCADVRDELGRALAGELGAAAAYVHLDVASETEWADAVAATQARFGPPTVLVNNAGIYRPRPLESLAVEDYLQTIRVNQLGVFLGMRACIAPMRAAGGGSIVNVSSTAGLEGVEHALDYTASKFAVTGMTRAAGIELAKHRIRVNSVHPGPIATPLIAEAYGAPDVQSAIGGTAPPVPMRRWAQPEEVAALVLYLASDESSYSTGSAFLVDGGLTAGIMTQ